MQSVERSRGPIAMGIQGEHTEYVCTKILGMSDEEFVELLKAGVLE